MADPRVERNRSHLARLFAGSFPGHAVVMSAESACPPLPGDVTCPDRPVGLWVDRALRQYEAELRVLAELDDDSVPVARITTGTQLFAAAFGCRVHLFVDSPPCALPLVETAHQADALVEPEPDAGPLARVYEAAARLRERLGPDVPIRVPDIQSPFDIAALIWRKESLYTAVVDHPEAVKRLVSKCTRLLRRFLCRFMAEVGECSLAHCPDVWAPPELGCWLSEDEAGAMSPAMFEEFCLPPLIELSEAFGGLFVHCCATADHQYPNFRRIPNLRGLNRVFQAPGPRPAIEAFTPGTVLMVAWTGIEACREMLDMALRETRFLFNMPAEPLGQAKATYERMREWCPRL